MEHIIDGLQFIKVAGFVVMFLGWVVTAVSRDEWGRAIGCGIISFGAIALGYSAGALTYID